MIRYISKDIGRNFQQIYISLETWARCLKVTEKVSINSASEASYVYILSRQKFIENA